VAGLSQIDGPWVLGLAKPDWARAAQLPPNFVWIFELSEASKGI
jgi:hypothetical protein